MGGRDGVVWNRLAGVVTNIISTPICAHALAPSLGLSPARKYCLDQKLITIIIIFIIIMYYYYFCIRYLYIFRSIIFSEVAAMLELGGSLAGLARIGRGNWVGNGREELERVGLSSSNLASLSSTLERDTVTL